MPLPVKVDLPVNLEVRVNLAHQDLLTRDGTVDVRRVAKALQMAGEAMAEAPATEPGRIPSGIMCTMDGTPLVLWVPHTAPETNTTEDDDDDS